MADDNVLMVAVKPDNFVFYIHSNMDDIQRKAEEICGKAVGLKIIDATAKPDYSIDNVRNFAGLDPECVTGLNEMLAGYFERAKVIEIFDSSSIEATACCSCSDDGFACVCCPCITPTPS